MGRLATGRVNQALRLEDATAAAGTVGIAQDEHPGAGGRGPAGGDDDATLAITKSDCPAVTKLAVRLRADYLWAQVPGGRCLTVRRSAIYVRL